MNKKQPTNEGSGGNPLGPSKKKPSKGKVVPIGGKGGPLSGPKPGPSPGPKKFWNSTGGIITIIGICLAVALILVGITYALTKKKVSKK